MCRRLGVVDMELCATLLLVTLRDIAARSTIASALLRRMMRGYEKLPPPGGPAIVQLGIYINYFYDISDITMDYSLSMYLRQQWYDSRLVFNPEDNNNSSKLKIEDFKVLWTPDVVFTNEKSAAFHGVTTDNKLFFVHSDGRVWYVSKVSALLSCSMSLQKYPLDTQHCPMTLESYGYAADEVTLKWLEPRDKAVQFDVTSEELPQFAVEDFDISDCSYNKTSAYPPGWYSCLRTTFTLRRGLVHHLVQHYAPSLLLVVLSWVSFWISIDAVVARVSIGLLTVLNLSLQSTDSRHELPRVSYVKAIDVWSAVCLVFAFASLVEFAVVNVWSRREANEAAGLAGALAGAAGVAGVAGAGGANPVKSGRMGASGSGGPEDGPDKPNGLACVLMDLSHAEAGFGAQGARRMVKKENFDEDGAGFSGETTEFPEYDAGSLVDEVFAQNRLCVMDEMEYTRDGAGFSKERVRFGREGAGRPVQRAWRRAAIGALRDGVDQMDPQADQIINRINEEKGLCDSETGTSRENTGSSDKRPVPKTQEAWRRAARAALAARRKGQSENMKANISKKVSAEGMKIDSEGRKEKHSDRTLTWSETSEQYRLPMLEKSALALSDSGNITACSEISSPDALIPHYYLSKTDTSNVFAEQGPETTLPQCNRASDNVLNASMVSTAPKTTTPRNKIASDNVTVALAAASSPSDSMTSRSWLPNSNVASAMTSLLMTSRRRLSARRKLVGAALVRRVSVQLVTPLRVRQARAMDRLARRLFPAAFLIFNVLYWLVYTL